MPDGSAATNTNRRSRGTLEFVAGRGIRGRTGNSWPDGNDPNGKLPIREESIAVYCLSKEVSRWQIPHATRC